MKIRSRVVALAALVLAAALGIWINFRPRVVSDGGSANQSPSAPSPSKAATTMENTSLAKTTNTLRGFSPPSRQGVGGQPADRDQLLKYAIEQANVPINFWGKVVDQNGVAVPGVEVQITVRAWESKPLSSATASFSNITRKTGDDGLFEVVGQAGDLLEFRDVRKEGYRLSSKTPRALRYETNAAAETPSEPVLFKMWKVSPSQPLVTGDKFLGISPDGRTYTIDLMKGTKTEGTGADGDLTVRILRPAKIEPRSRYDWECTVRVPSGGILETEDEFMYLAPAAGYKAQYHYVFKSTQEQWTDSVKKQFYLQSRGGTLFGRLDVEIIPTYNDQSVFSLKYAVNPAGSRNLQP